MVLTRRASNAHMEITRWLPNEVIAEIVQAAQLADQASLCRVSHLITYDLSLPILNRAVELRHYDSAGAFCCAIIENPLRGDAIRYFSIPAQIRRKRRLRRDNFHLDNWFGFSLQTSLGELVTKAMKLMHRLEHLVIHLSYASPILMGCTFPRLVTCDIGVSMSPGDMLLPFLQRHPDLTRLRIAVDDGIAIAKGTSISLLHLEHFDEPASLIPALVDSPSLMAEVLERALECGLACLAMEISRSDFRVPPEIQTTFSVDAWAVACPTLQTCCVSVDTADGGPGAWKKVNGNWEPCSRGEFQVQAGLPLD
ncbi:hypothetical protein B0H14DRAFT_2599862 [Mycena olivaceomarginata]|nr:hypothetical protein B0H14DRAFT_2599862 [Mycena olivaceomarginata]